MLIKTDSDIFYRDTTTGALINNDENGWVSYKERRRKLKQTNRQLNKVDDLELRVDSLTSEIHDLKETLTELITILKGTN